MHAYGRQKSLQRYLLWGLLLSLALSLILGLFRISLRKFFKVPSNSPELSRALAPKPLIMVSLPPQAYLLKRLAPDLLDIHIMLPANANHHTYEPKVADLAALGRARLYIKLGDPNFLFETTLLNDILHNLQKTSPQLKILTNLPTDTLLNLHHDMHVWLSPRLMQIMLTTTKGALLDLFPEKRSLIEQNYQDTLSEIRNLAAEFTKLVQKKKSKSFLIFHDSLGHLAAEYGLEQIAIEQGHHDPDSHRLIELLKRAQKLGLKNILVEPQFNYQAAKVIAQELQGELLLIDPLKENWLESMEQIKTALDKALPF